MCGWQKNDKTCELMEMRYQAKNFTCLWDKIFCPLLSSKKEDEKERNDTEAKNKEA